MLGVDIAKTFIIISLLSFPIDFLEPTGTIEKGQKI